MIREHLSSDETVVGSDLAKVSALDAFCSSIEYESTVWIHVLTVGRLYIKCKPLLLVELLSHPEINKEAFA